MTIAKWKPAGQSRCKNSKAGIQCFSPLFWSITAGRPFAFNKNTNFLPRQLIISSSPAWFSPGFIRRSPLKTFNCCLMAAVVTDGLLAVFCALPSLSNRTISTATGPKLKGCYHGSLYIHSIYTDATQLLKNHHPHMCQPPALSHVPHTSAFVGPSQ